MSEKIKVFVLVFSVFLFSVILTSFFIYKNYEKRKEIYLQTITQAFEALYQNNSYLLKERSHNFYDMFINKENIIKIIAKAIENKNDRNRFKRLREEMYKKLYKEYNYMKKYNLQELNFNFSDFTSFIRFYRPEKYGDSLKGIRKSLEIVQKNKEPVSCFEIGRAVHGFRNVYPLYYKGYFVGTADVAYHANSIISGIESALPVYVGFIIDQKSLLRKLDKDEHKNYVESYIFKGFFEDKDTKIFNKEAKEIKEEIEGINKDLFKKIENNLKLGESFSTNFKIKEKDYLITFINVKDCEGRSSAYFVIYKPDRFFRYNFYSFILTLSASILFLFFMFFFLYCYLTKQIEHKKRLIKISETDPLTGIANRRAFIQKIKDVVEDSKKFGTPLSLVLFDIDNFKKVNDMYGHDVGDYVLKEISKIVSAQLRKNRFFC